jgi:glucokinase
MSASDAVPAALRIVLDVGGSSIKSGRVSGTCVEGFRRDPYDAHGEAEAILAVYRDVIRAHAAAAATPIREVVLAHPGPFDYARGVCLVRGVAKLESLYGLSVRDALASVLPPSCGLRFLNDAEAAIRGEARHGAGRPWTRILGLTLGTGLGSAFVARGEAVREGPGVPDGGEVYALPWAGGIADQEFSSRGLRHRLRDVPGGRAPFEAIGRRLSAGESPLVGIFAAFGADLGTFLAPQVGAFAADGVIVLGGLANLLPYFGPALEARVSVPVVEGELGPHAPLLGAVP